MISFVLTKYKGLINFKIKVMKKNYSLNVLCFIFCVCFIFLSKAQSETIILFEDFSSASKGDDVSASSSLWAGNDHIVLIDKVYEAGGTVKLGTSGAVGSITTKALDLSQNNGVFKVQFKVKGWNNSGKVLVTVSDLPSQEISYSGSKNDSFEQVEVVFTGGKKDATIRIETLNVPANLRRAFIDDLKVYYGGSNLNNNANLSELKVNNELLNGFSSSKSGYFYNLSSGIDVPVLSAKAEDANANVVISNLSTLPGYAYVDVTAENGTTVKRYSVYLSQESSEGEKGSKSNPYTIDEARSNQHPAGVLTKYWMKGYIAGAVNGTINNIETSGFTKNTNLVLSPSADTDVSDTSLLVPVELPIGSVRNSLNLVDNNHNYKKEIKLYGTLESYFSSPGIRSVSDYVLDILSTEEINYNEEVSVLSTTVLDDYLSVLWLGRSKIEIYSINGKLVKSAELADKQPLYVADLNPGIYIVRILNDRKVKSIKVVKK